MDPIENQIRDLFSRIQYGNSGKDIMESNTVYSLVLDEGKAEIVLIIPAIDSDLKDNLCAEVEKALLFIEGINEVKVDTSESADAAEDASPTSIKSRSHDHDHSHHHGRKKKKKKVAPSPEKNVYCQNYDNVILVASGKGGVGKSTVSLNLALALKATGKTVSVLDADIYGPSIPLMMGMRDEQPDLVGRQIQTLNKYGIDYLSIGNLVTEDQSLIWRGPMVHSALEQMLRDVSWPGGDYLIVDLPPGTGDVQISISQMLEVAGSVIVSTPQDVALIDARKAVKMFDKVQIPVLGMVENMSFFVCPHCEKETAIFSTGGTEQESKDNEVRFLGKIPIELAIREGADSGKPVVADQPDSIAAGYYMDIAKNINEIFEAE